MSKILIIGDMHLRETAGYASHFKDGRKEERHQIKIQIVKAAEECDAIVLMGDNFHKKNNPSGVVSEFVEFLESFRDKRVYILAGNHEKWGDGRSAIDFIDELDGKNWVPIIREPLVVEGLTFMPFMSAQELGVEGVKEWTDALMALIKPNEHLFIHHSISESFITGNMTTDKLTGEPVLSRKELGKMFKRVYAGHIHTPSSKENVTITGSTFTNEAGDADKFVYILDTKENTHKEVRLKQFTIKTIENPTAKDVKAAGPFTILKVKMTKEVSEDEMKELKEALDDMGTYTFTEEIPRTRKKIHLDNHRNVLEFNTEELLREYAKQREVDFAELKQAFELIT